ncbi:conjugal transfer protein TraD [Parashewanella spongiae]|uniref:Conjugal transfer protein TraD n=1 Tax=Parashewanella spongiae TaxID=342950 RepID=A0A3A6U112_9GAMM|nr:conjugal transfer protein TraD [Parashewanella spongiae]
MNDKLLTLNSAGEEVELTQQEAEELGAVEETAITEKEAVESTQTDEG